MERDMASEHRSTIFWIAIAATALATVVLLHQILMPFVLAMALAYLLVPAVNRLERLGISRSLSALTLVLALVVGAVTLALVILPALVGELRFLIGEFPRYVARLQAMLAGTSRPWLQKIIGPEFHIEQSAAKMVTTGGPWLDDLLGYLWSGGQAIISIISLLVVTPILAIYFLVDWE